MFTTLTSIFVLVFSTPESDTMIGIFDTAADCDEIAWVMSPHVSAASLICEEIPPCKTEDSTECFWDAETMGNGNGNSFIAW